MNYECTRDDRLMFLRLYNNQGIAFLASKFVAPMLFQGNNNESRNENNYQFVIP